MKDFAGNMICTVFVVRYSVKLLALYDVVYTY